MVAERAAATSTTTSPSTAGRMSRDCWETSAAAVFGKPAATPVTVTQRLVPPAGVAQMTNCPAQFEGSVTTVLNVPVALVAVPEALKLTAPGPLDSEMATGTPAGNGVPSGCRKVPLNVKDCPQEAAPGALPVEPGPTV